jgi:acyl carrier protein
MTQETETKLVEVFRAVLSLGGDSDVTDARQLSTQGWDSLAHVSLVAALESEFGISIDIADSLQLTSYRAVRLYLAERGA